MGKTRLEAFSDGVIAIIITIMVLEMRAPHGTDFDALGPVLPVFGSYVLSFVHVGIYWNNHHHLLHTARQVNGGILWANQIPAPYLMPHDAPVPFGTISTWDAILLEGALAKFNPREEPLTYYHRTGPVGAMVHETVHCVQNYRGRGLPGWLVEGIADYVRFWKYEPGKAGRLTPERARYDGSYRVTAAFLAYVSDKYDPKLVTKLNAEMFIARRKPSRVVLSTNEPLSSSLLASTVDELMG